MVLPQGDAESEISFADDYLVVFGGDDFLHTKTDSGYTLSVEPFKSVILSKREPEPETGLYVTKNNMKVTALSSSILEVL